MKKINIYVCLLFVLGFLSCAQEPDSEFHGVKPEFELPSGTPMADSIASFYYKYGSFIRYDFTQLELEFAGMSGSSFVPTDEASVSAALPFLKEVWFQFYPDEFLKKYLPYQILLVDSLWNGDYEDKYEDWCEFYTCVYGNNSIGVASCMDMGSMSREEKLEYKNALNYELMLQWFAITSTAIFSVPESFYALSDYKNAESDPAECRKRGFLPDINENGELYEWAKYIQYYDEKMDLKTYLRWMVNLPEDSPRWQEWLQAPLIRQKYDILVKALKVDLGLDILKIGNTTFE